MALRDEGAVRATVLGLDFRQGHDLIDDAGQFQAGLAAFDLRHENLAVEVIEALVQDGDEHHVLAACVLQVGERTDHFLAEQAIGRAQIGLAGAVAHGPRLRLAPRKTLARQLRDRVEEKGQIAVKDGRVTKLLNDVIKVRLGERRFRRQRLVRTREEHEEVTALGPGRRANGVARPVGHRQITGLDVEKQRAGGVKIFEPGGLADAGFAQHQELHTLALGHALLRGDDGKRHHATSFNCSATAGFQRIW